MATVTKTIGATGRDYSEINLWEADLDDTGIYSSGDDAVGECYADSDFTNEESLVINGGTTVGLNSVKLTVAAGERHNGTADTGVRLLYSSSGNLDVDRNDCVVEWLDIDGNDNVTGGFGILDCQSQTGIRFARNLLHGSTSGAMPGILASGATVDIVNSIIFHLTSNHTGSNNADGVAAFGTPTWACYNVTIHDIINNNGSGRATCFWMASGTGTKTAKNCIGTDPSGSTSGTKECFTTTGATEDYNLSSDATAAGANSLTNKSSSDQFISTVVDSENLLLKPGADAIDAGQDLGTTPTDVNIDITNYDRDAEAVTWDMGSHEFREAPHYYTVWRRRNAG